MDWIARHRRLVMGLICACWAGVVLISQLFPAWPFLSVVSAGEQGFQDLLRREGRKTPAREDFAFVGIDQQSLQLDAVGPEEIATNRAFQLMTERPYPWSREIWSLFLEKVFSAGARLVMFDLVFNPPNDGDSSFAAALERYQDRVVIGVNFDEARGTLIGPNAKLIPPPPESDNRVGLVNFWPDITDGKVRAARYLISERQLAAQEPFAGEPLYGSLSAKGLEKIGHAADVPRELQRYAFRFGEGDAYAPVSLWEIFDERSWKANLGGGAFFKDKILIVGASAQIMHDVVSTPLSPSMYGPALHLHAMAAALAHEFLTYSNPRLTYLLVPSAALAAWALIAFLRRPLISLFALTGISAGYLLAARLCYDHSGFFLMTVPLLATFLGGGASSLGLDYVLERREKLKTRRTLERYVSKNLVKDILENPESFYSTMRGKRIPVSVLFTDLVGFTTLSERADPEELVRQLNEYLSKMVGVVFQHNGTLDKFIGDAIMAVWGNVQSAGAVADAKACARTALGMRAALKQLNEGWRKEGRMGLGMGVGINSGEALAGNIGSGDRADLTVIGDAVNLASRLEGLTRTYGVDLLVGERTAELIRDEFHLRSVARVQVKGKMIPVSISALLCAKGAENDAEFLKWLQDYEAGIADFRERKFTEAKVNFSRFLVSYPDDYLARSYLARAVEYEKAPPPESWNGAEIFTKK